MEAPRLDLRSVLMPGLEPQLVQKLMGRLKLANFMDLPEQDFRELVKDVENDPLFRKFCYARQSDDKILSFRRFASTSVSSRCCELNEEISPQNGGTPDIESIVDERKDIAAMIQKLGVDKFRRFFLYGDEDLTVPEIAANAGVSLQEAEKIFDFLNTVFVHQEFYPSSDAPDPGRQLNYSKVASIERLGDGFTIGYIVPAFARGRYHINYEKLESLKKKKELSREEAKKFESLLKKLEFINARKNMLYQVLKNAIEIQDQYLRTGNTADLAPFILKKLAAKIGVSLSLVSRAIQGKSIDTPWGEKPVRFFFPNEKESKKRLVREVIAAETRSYSDEQIRRILLEKYNIAISRRAINLYRQSMEISSSYVRRKDAAEPPRPQQYPSVPVHYQ